MCAEYYELRYMVKKIAPHQMRLLDAALTFALFSVSGLKEEKLITKQSCMKTEKCKLYSRVVWIFVPNFIWIDPYDFELYRFKVGAFFMRHNVCVTCRLWRSVADVCVQSVSDVWLCVSAGRQFGGCDACSAYNRISRSWWTILLVPACTRWDFCTGIMS